MNELQNQGELKRTLSLPLLIGFGLAYLAPTVVFNYYGIWTCADGTAGHCIQLHSHGKGIPSGRVSLRICKQICTAAYRLPHRMGNDTGLSPSPYGMLPASGNLHQ